MSPQLQIFHEDIDRALVVIPSALPLLAELVCARHAGMPQLQAENRQRARDQFVGLALVGFARIG